MIRPLRSRHRTTFVVLALALPALFAAGLLARRPVPPVGNLPGAVADTGVAGGAGEIVVSVETLGGLPVAGRLVRDEDRFVLRLDVLRDLGRPELLVYWSGAREGAAADGLPPDAALLGRLDTARTSVHALPAGALESGGSVILYSPVHGAVAAREPLPAILSLGGGGT